MYHHLTVLFDFSWIVVIYIKECKLPANAAERMALEAIVREKNAEDDDVVIRKSSLIYVPKWSINIRITHLKFFSFLNTFQ